MKFKTLLLAGLITLAAGLSSASAASSSPAFLAAGSDFGGDTLVVGLFAAVLVVGCWLGRCHGGGKKSGQQALGADVPETGRGRDAATRRPPSSSRHAGDNIEGRLGGAAPQAPEAWAHRS